MKNRSNFKDYGKGVLSFGKYKGKTIKQIIIDKEDYGYVVWLNDNVKSITISESDYNFCKKAVDEDKLLNNVITESCHENWGRRD